jgi:ABC-2 type transport system permease protein
MSKPIAAIVAKDLKLLVRDPGGLLMLFALPALFIAVLSVSLRGAFSSTEEESRIAVLVAYAEDSRAGQMIYDGLDAAEHFRLVRVVDGERLTADRAAALVAEGAYRIAVIVPDGADAALGLQKRAKVRLVVDPALSPEIALALEGAVRNLASLGTMGGLLARQGYVVRGQTPKTFLERKGLSVSLETAARGASAALPNSVQQNVPGWTIFAMFWISQILAISIINERVSGAFTRLLVAPISLGHYAIGKLLPYLLVNVVQAALMFAIGVYALPLLGCPRLEIANVPALALLTLAVSLVAIGFGFLIASLSRSSLLVASLSAAAIIVMTAVGGIMVPKFIMPSAMQTLSWFVPHGWALEGYLDVLVRGKGVVDVLPHLGALLGFAAVSFAVGAVRLRRIHREGA